MKVRGIALSVLLTLGVTHALHAEVPQNIRLGTEPAYAPFESKMLRVKWWVLTLIWQKSCADE